MVETGAKDDEGETENGGKHDDNQNPIKNVNEVVGVANDETGAGGTSGKDDNAVKQNQSTQEGLDFDKIAGSVPDLNRERNVLQQKSPGSSRGKSHTALLKAYKRTKNGMCLVEKVMSVKGKGDKKEVKLKWADKEESWQPFVEPYENLTGELGEHESVFVYFF